MVWLEANNFANILSNGLHERPTRQRKIRELNLDWNSQFFVIWDRKIMRAMLENQKGQPNSPWTMRENSLHMGRVWKAKQKKTFCDTFDAIKPNSMRRPGFGKPIMKHASKRDPTHKITYQSIFFKPVIGIVKILNGKNNIRQGHTSWSTFRTNLRGHFLGGAMSVCCSNSNTNINCWAC